MDDTSFSRLRTLLHQVQLTMSDSASSHLSPDQQDLFNDICRLVFDEQIYQFLWDDFLLSQIDWLFRIEPPASMFNQQVAELRKRVQEAQHVNDFFCRILDHDSAIEEVCESLNVISPVESSLLVLLKTSDRLSVIRKADGSPSEKIIAFLDFLQDDAGLNLKAQEFIIRMSESS